MLKHGESFNDEDIEIPEDDAGGYDADSDWMPELMEDDDIH